MVKKKILFVCLGNICRSPAAEAVMVAKLKESGMNERIICDSAGILGYHAGEKADVRMRNHAVRRGYKVTSLSRKVRSEHDFEQFDMIIGMDEQNIKDLNLLVQSAAHRKKIFRMTEFSSQTAYDHIPDPYYGGSDGFELVLDLLEDACDGLLEYLEKKNI